MKYIMIVYANYLERKLMERLQMSFKEAGCLLEIPEKEIKEIEKYFQS